MSPWELGATYLLIPVLVLCAWFIERSETDGASVPEFEGWCRTREPVLVAIRCSKGQSRNVATALNESIGPRCEVEHHRGRHPWTLYLLKLGVDHDEESGVVRVRAKSATMRRLKETRPEIGALVDRVTSDLGSSITTLWVHADLRMEDEEPDPNRRERGWVRAIDDGVPSSFKPTVGLPSWACGE